MIDIIRELAKEKNMSITSLEQTLGLGNGTIGKWKKQNPTCDKLKLVADYLGVTIDYLLTGKENILLNDKLSNEYINLFYQLTEVDKGRILNEMENYIKKYNE